MVLFVAVALIVAGALVWKRQNWRGSSVAQPL